MWISLGCSRCLKGFIGRVGERRDFSGFDRSKWTPRDDRKHRDNVNKLRNCATKSALKEAESENGCRYRGVSIHWTGPLDNWTGLLDWTTGLPDFSLIEQKYSRYSIIANFLPHYFPTARTCVHPKHLMVRTYRTCVHGLMEKEKMKVSNIYLNNQAIYFVFEEEEEGTQCYLPCHHKHAKRKRQKRWCSSSQEEAESR